MQLDPTFTQAMQRYLAQTSDDRDVAQGALLLFQLTGNAYLYHNALLHPQKYAPTIEHELKKHLQIRLDGLTRQEVAQLEKESLPRIQQTINQGAPTAKSQAHTGQPTITTDTDHPQAQHRGRRPDHDSLAKDIQALYDRNGDIYYKMKTLYNQLLQMESSTPCDRYELLKQLRQADDHYRANWQRYDAWETNSPEFVSSGCLGDGLSRVRKSRMLGRRTLPSS